MERIALCGVFDIPNYGDHLFPLIVKNELHKRNCDFEIVLFSPFDAQESFVEDSHIYSLDDMERMHQENPFKAILIGGGEIIHWHRYQQKHSFSSDSYEPYPMDKVWAIPFLMKLKYNVPIIWNAPGIPYDFDIDPNFANFLFSNIDYVSVRNDFSRQVLLDCGIRPEIIHLVPDTGFELTTLASAEHLNKLRRDLLLDTDKYIVFHCNRFIAEADENAAFNMLNNLYDQGYSIYLLPLAYTHGDDTKLREIRERSGNRFNIPEKPLSLLQIISVLSGCTLYVGTSLHGTVTASAYGRKVVSFDYQKTKKTKDLYDKLGLSDYYTVDRSSLQENVSKALNEQVPADISDIQSEIKQHFDNIVSVLECGKVVTANPCSQASQFSDMVHFYFANAYECQGLRQRVNELTDALELNQNFVEIFKSRSESLKDENERLRSAYEKTLRHKLSKIKRKTAHQ